MVVSVAAAIASAAAAITSSVIAVAATLTITAVTVLGRVLLEALILLTDVGKEVLT